MSKSSKDTIRLVEPDPILVEMTYVTAQYGSGESSDMVIRADHGDTMTEYEDSYVFVKPKSGQSITLFKRHLAGLSVITKLVKVPAPTNGSTTP